MTQDAQSEDPSQNGEAGGLAHKEPEEQLRILKKAHTDVTQRQAERIRQLEAENQRLRNAEDGARAGRLERASSDSPEYSGPHGLTWQSPLPLSGDETPGPIPVSVYPDWLQDFVESLADFVQVARDLPALLVLAMLAGALQKKAVVKARRGWTVPLSLWGSAVLPSGERKSPAYQKATSPVEEHERRLREDLEAERLEAQDRQDVLEERLRKAKAEAAKASGDDDRAEAEEKVREAREELHEHEVPTLPRLWVDDTTSEALLELLSEHHGRMLAMSPEGDLFKYMAGRYQNGGGVLNVYKKAWTGSEAVRDDRITRDGFDVQNPALSVGICVQPQVLEDLAQKRAFRGEGIIARFLYVVPEPKAGRRKTGRDVPPMDSTAKARYEKKMRTLLELEPKSVEDGDYVPHTLRLEEDARPVLWDWEEEVENMLQAGGHLDGMKDWGNKLVGQTLRIAGLLHVAETEELDGPISADVIRRAVHLGRAFIPHARRAYGLLNANEKTRLARYVFRRICEEMGLPQVPNIPTMTRNDSGSQDAADSGYSGNTGKVGPITKRDLWHATRGKSEIGEVGDLEEPLQQLEEHHLIQVIEQQQDGPGRNPSPKIYLNPALLPD